MSKRRSTNAVKEETTDSFALLNPESGELPLNSYDPAAMLEAAGLKDRAELVSIDLSIGPYHEKQRRPEHIEARLTPAQGRKLQRLHNGLVARYGVGWSTKNPTYADVVRWLIDRLPDSEPQQEQAA